ncbi:MAG: glycosyltransferase family 2 protein [Candidatus Zixiibacteriota bacterium]
MIENNDQRLPLISVVVPVRNEGPFIRRTLEYIAGQDYPADKLEIFVVDGFSEDGTREIVLEMSAADSRIKLLDNLVRLSSAGRNIGARAAKGELVIYIDGHVYIDGDQLLVNTVRLMREKKVEVLSRPQFLDTPDNNFMQQAISLARKSVIGHGRDSTIYTVKESYVDPTSSGASYHRNIFDRVGYFDENFDAAEDLDFNYRVASAGFKSFTSPELAVYYYPRTSLPGLFKQMKRYGTGRFRFVQKHPETLSAAMLAPTVLLVTLLGLLVASFWISIVPFATIAGAYLLTLLTASFAISAGCDWRFLPVLPAVFVTIHFGLAWGFLREAISSLFGRNGERHPEEKL